MPEFVSATSAGPLLSLTLRGAQVQHVAHMVPPDSSPTAGETPGGGPAPDALRDGLFRLGRVMERVDDLDQLLRRIIEECKRMLRCEAASVALYDAERNDLVFAVASGGSEEGVTQWRMKMGQGIAGLVAETREPLFSNDPQNDSRWFAAVDDSSGFETHNLAAVPMVHSGDLVGVVEALNRPDAAFGEEDLVLLQIFADQAALALEIHRLIKAKQESERLATFAVALADIGHNAKNLLMRLEFPIQLIDRAIQGGDLDRARESWRVMKEATREIGQLVRDMLEYSKPREPDLVDIDVAELVRAVISDCAPDAGSKQIHLLPDGIAEPRSWVLDPTFLSTALHNLVGNAIEALAKHGGSRVTLAVATASEGAELRVSVTDDGPGIPPEIQGRIFDPFFSTKGKQGTGLGLASVKKGVEEHGGRVSLICEPGKGARFVLAFPKAEIKRQSE